MLFAIVLLAATAIWRPHFWESAKGAKSLPSGDFFIVFRDRSSSTLEYVYIVARDQIAAQVAEYDGFGQWKDRKWYWLKPAPRALLDQARTWAAREGDKPPPWIPEGGPPFGCTTFTNDSDSEVSGFSGQQDGVSGWFATLSDALVKEQCRVSTLPPWMEANETLKHEFGIYEKK